MLLQPDQDFWPRLMQVGILEPGIVCNIAARLDNRPWVRAANRTSRMIMNSCVSHVSHQVHGDSGCRPTADLTTTTTSTTDLADVFPNADTFKLTLGQNVLDSSQLTSLAASWSRFFGQLHTFHVVVESAEAASAACAVLLPRCAQTFACSSSASVLSSVPTVKR
jgi:hypothetical protein